MQWFHEWYITNHAMISFIVGPIIIAACFQIPRLWISAKLLLSLVMIVLITGMLGLINNTVAIIITLMLIAIKKGILITPIEIIFRLLAVILGLSVGALFLYTLFTNPSVILKNWWNPAQILYMAPSIIFWGLADWAADARSKKSVEKTV